MISQGMNQFIAWSFAEITFHVEPPRRVLTQNMRIEDNEKLALVPHHQKEPYQIALGKEF
jgi:hypothetical protein